MGVTDNVKSQQAASSLLEGKALTWWRMDCAASLNLPTSLELDDFAISIEAAFVDLAWVHHLRIKLSQIK